MRRMTKVLLLFVILVGIVLIPYSLAQDVNTANTNGTSSVYTSVYNKVSPSVVAIDVVSRRPVNSSFPSMGNGTVMGSGTGFVIDADGHIVTNNHVVEGATSIEVSFVDGTLTRAQVVGTDPNSDLAVLKVDVSADRLHPVQFGDSDSLQIGQEVLAIGSPFGERWTLTSGIVSALDRTIQGLTNFSIGGVIQTDAPINPGNSGGPLLNLDGQVVGVNSQILSQSGSSAGVGFSIPSNLVQKVSQKLIQNGSVQYSFLGISGGDVNLPLMDALKLPDNTQGVVVGSVDPTGPAASAGLQNPSNTTLIDGLDVPQHVDIITAINDQPLNGMADLVTYLANHTQPGDTVNLSVLRNGTDNMSVSVLLTTRPSS